MSISSVVELQEETDELDKQMIGCKINKTEEESSEEDTEKDLEAEEYECVVCKQEILGEFEFEEHQRVFKHWG